MIVCSCTEITSKDIEEAVAALRTNDPFVVLTPGLIYRQLGKRPSCGRGIGLTGFIFAERVAHAPLNSAALSNR